MSGVLLSLLIASAIFGLTEYIRITRHVSHEVSRKVVHIIHALTVASWPFFVSYRYVIAAEVLFLVAAITVRNLRLFHWLREVGRDTFGDVFFPLGIIASALLSPSKWIFLIALLHLGLADGLAALIGKQWGRRNSYKVFGHQKSLTGTVTFLVVSIGITASIVLIPSAGLHHLASTLIFLLPLTLTVVENFTGAGVDNLIIPVLAVVLLSPLQMFN